MTDKQKVWTKIEEMISSGSDYWKIERKAQEIANQLNVPVKLILEGIKLHHAYEFRDVT